MLYASADAGGYGRWVRRRGRRRLHSASTWKVAPRLICC